MPDAARAGRGAELAWRRGDGVAGAGGHPSRPRGRASDRCGESSVAPLYAMVPGVDATIVTEWRGSLTDRRTLKDDVQRDERRTDRSRHPVSQLVRVSVGGASGASEGSVGICGRPAAAVADEGDRPARRFASSGRLLPAPRPRARDADRSARTGRRQFRARRSTRPGRCSAARGWDRSRPLLVVAPGAAYGTAKRWLPSHFASLVTRAIQETGAHGVLVGTAADADTARLVLESIGVGHRAAVIDLTGATTLETLAAVMSLAAACVSNDSGAMHLAGAVGTPLAALFGPTRDRETAPLTRQGGRPRC